MSERKKSQRILIVNVNWIGDALFSTPAIRAIRKSRPDAYLACLVPARCEAVLKGNPHLDQVIVYNERTPLVFSWGTWLKMRAGKFDTAVFFHRSKTKAFLAFLAGIPERMGYAAPYRKAWLTRSCSPPPGHPHKIDYFLNLTARFDMPADGRTMDFFPSKAAARSASEILQNHGIAAGEPYAVLHAGGNWELKRWPAAHFARFIELFLADSDCKVVLCGTKGEETLIKRIAAHFPFGRVAMLAGKTTFDELGVIIRGAAFLLSNDSGPIHLAASQKTPIVGLFGPTSPEETGPVSAGPVTILRKDVGCEIPCYFHSCDHRVCMELLTPEEAVSAAQAFIR